MLLTSRYFDIWNKCCDLESSTKCGYITAFHKFDKFLEHVGYNGELNFDRFYSYQSGTHKPIDEKFIDAFVAHLETTGSSKSTLYSTLSALTSFFDFLEDVDLVKHNPLRYYHNPYYEDNVRDNTLGLVDVGKLLSAAKRMEPFFRQTYVLILVLVSTGLRSKEIRSLRWSQINFEQGTIMINRGQKRTVHPVYLRSDVALELKRYLKHPCWMLWSMGEDKEVFFDGGKPLSYYRLQRIIDEVVDKAGLKKRYTSHDFRHTLATLMDDAGINPRIIQMQMRHNFLSTTIRYMSADADVGDVINQSAKDMI